MPSFHPSTVTGALKKIDPQRWERPSQTEDGGGLGDIDVYPRMFVDQAESRIPHSSAREALRLYT